MTISGTSAGSNAATEALESAATARAEAAKGDPQAIRKLANQQTAPQSAVDPDHDGDPGKLNVTA